MFNPFPNPLCSVKDNPELKAPSVHTATLMHLVGLHMADCGLGSSVGIVTDYGLDSPGLNPGGDEIFSPSSLALGPTQPPIKWVPGLSRG